ncbi:MAG TPA: LamG-like jellyroll fold domain-containing protein, partial [Thermoanaerobaculia bacterium]|nr:LamG-like jellyroll fold domain-containing protein [Thermoanaerobaculia bacterium]
MRGVRGIVGALIAALIALGATGVASAATLKASYQLRGTLSSDVPGAPDLTSLGAGNSFISEEIDGVSRQVLAFPKGNGLALNTTGLVDPRSYSVVVLFRLAELGGYRRILDFSDSTSDDGFYNFSGKAVIYGGGAASRGVVFGESYAQVTFTSTPAGGDSAAQRVVAYVDGSQAASATAPEGFQLAAGALRLFQDNTSGPAGGEESAGAVACVLVYDGALSAAEVEQLAAEPTLC